MITELQRQKRRELYQKNKEKISEYRKNYRNRTENLSTKKYEKTEKGFLMRCYRNMESRTRGIQHLKAHLYKGKTLLSRENFYAWSLADKDFHSLFKAWCESNYNRKLTPSINRIDSAKGYELNNMEWITHSENSRKTTRWGLA